jgi:hypothetical protein
MRSSAIYEGLMCCQVVRRASGLVVLFAACCGLAMHAALRFERGYESAMTLCLPTALMSWHPNLFGPTRSGSI